MYHKPDLNEALSTQERPMWYVNSDAVEFWERDEAVEKLQDIALESMVTTTRWRTIEDPRGKTCFYNLKTGHIQYDPPRSVPWRYAANTLAKAFPVQDSDEEHAGVETTAAGPKSPERRKTKRGTRKSHTRKATLKMGDTIDPWADDDEEDSDDGFPPTRTIRVARGAHGTARFTARAGNDPARFVPRTRQERMERSKKAGWSSAIALGNSDTAFAGATESAPTSRYALG